MGSTSSEVVGRLGRFFQFLPAMRDDIMQVVMMRGRQLSYVICYVPLTKFASKRTKQKL